MFLKHVGVKVACSFSLSDSFKYHKVSLSASVPYIVLDEGQHVGDFYDIIKNKMLSTFMFFGRWNFTYSRSSELFHSAAASDPQQ